MNRYDTSVLRGVAARIVARADGSFASSASIVDAAYLTDIADRMEEALRPRSRREREGTAPGLWLRLCRIWTGRGA